MSVEGNVLSLRLSFDELSSKGVTLIHLPVVGCRQSSSRLTEYRRASPGRRITTTSATTSTTTNTMTTTTTTTTTTLSTWKEKRWRGTASTRRRLRQSWRASTKTRPISSRRDVSISSTKTERTRRARLGESDRFASNWKTLATRGCCTRTGSVDRTRTDRGCTVTETPSSPECASGEKTCIAFSRALEISRFTIYSVRIILFTCPDLGH